jgi:hypothetical protein
MSKTFVLFRGEYLCDLGVYPERSRMGALWLIRKAVLVCVNPRPNPKQTVPYTSHFNKMLICKN